jgi:hypothetical protein
MISPDVCKVNSINQLVAGLWPGLAGSIETLVLNQLSIALEAVPFLTVGSISIGKAPPVILGLKHYPQTARGAVRVFDRNLPARMPLSFTPLRCLKRYHARNQ